VGYGSDTARLSRIDSSPIISAMGLADDMSWRYRTGAFHDTYGWGEEQAGPWKAGLVLDFMAANQVEPRRACEVGCGTGAVIRRLAEEMPGTSFTGFDIAPVIGTNEERPNLRFELRDIVTEPPTELFDLALLLDVIEHVENPWELLRSVRRSASMAIFHIPLELSAQSMLRPRALHLSRETQGHLHFFTRESALWLLSESGFEVVAATYTPSWRWAAKRRLRSAIAFPLRLALTAISEEFAARAVGGMPLLVLCR
jgi:SAM-dependent methyltransferase